MGFDSAILYLRKPLYLAVEIPLGLLQVLKQSVLLPCAPKVLHRIAEIEVHVFGDGDAFDTAGVRRVVFWMVDGIVPLGRRHPALLK